MDGFLSLWCNLCLALHPLYLNLEEMAGKKNAAIIKSLKKIQKQLNDLPDLDYEKVMQTKTGIAKELFAAKRSFPERCRLQRVFRPE
jgi:4-alpha-glucanotransferase